jgi:hypothetical protein
MLRRMYARMICTEAHARTRESAHRVQARRSWFLLWCAEEGTTPEGAVAEMTVGLTVVGAEIYRRETVTCSRIRRLGRHGP